MRWNYYALLIDGIELLGALWMGILRAAWASRYEQHRYGYGTNLCRVDAALEVEMKLTGAEAHQDFGIEANPPIGLK